MTVSSGNGAVCPQYDTMLLPQQRRGRRHAVRIARVGSGLRLSSCGLLPQAGSDPLYWFGWFLTVVATAVLEPTREKSCNVMQCGKGSRRVVVFQTSSFQRSSKTRSLVVR